MKIHESFYYEKFFPERLTQLRTNKNVSAREMSLSLGQSENYINKIENRKAFPTMANFFYICAYLGVSPQEFFEVDNRNPREVNELLSDFKQLDDNARAYIVGIVKSILKQ